MIMEDKDLEQTKPINILKDIDKESSTRESKYKDAVLKADKKEKEEEAEEALAERNITIAEELLEEESKKKKIKIELDKEIDKELDDDKKKSKKVGLVSKIKTAWGKLSKKQRILVMVLGGFLLFLVLFLVIFLIIKLTSKPDDTPLVTPPEEEVIPVIVDNFYYKEGSLYLLNSADTEIGSYECENKDDSLCYVALNSNRDEFDVTKLVDEEGNIREQRLPILHDNYVFIYDNKNQKNVEVILYSIKDKTEVARYLEVKSYSNGDIIIKNAEGKYGLINIDSEKGIVEKIKPKYQYLGMMEGQTNYIAQTKDGYFVVNNKGKEQSESFEDSVKIKSYSDKFVVTLTGKEYGVYDYEGNLIDSGYDFATTYDKYALLVKDNRLYVRDIEKNKYTESGIKLNTNDYVKTHVYDKDGAVIETKRCFEVKVNEEDELEFTLWKNGTDEMFYERLSLAEANVNKSYSYVNYFDGKLYFYEDETKEELLGFYSCTNTNTVDMKSTRYSSCFIANDTLFSDNDMMPTGYLYRNSTIPIINNRFAFIADGNNNIVLFDIVEKVSKSSYTKVETNTLDNQYKVTKYEGTMDVIVQNKKKNYAVLTIGKDTVDVKHGFEYSKLEFLGDYILGLDSSNYWRILFGDVESMGFNNKIRGYSSNKNYFKVMENDKYYVYNASASKISTTGYSYVELYTDYYAALDSNRNLSVYDYNGNKLSDDTVKIGNHALYSTESPAFKVIKDGEDYKASVWDGSQYNVTVLKKKKEEVVVPPEVEKEETDKETTDDDKTEDKENTNTGDKEETDKDTDNKDKEVSSTDTPNNES